MKRERRRMLFTASRMAMLGYLAGKGCSASEIAAALDMRPGTVRWLLFENKIPLAPKSAAEVSFPIVVPKRALEDLKALSGELGLAPDDLLARLLEAVLAERNVARNLLDIREAAE